MAPHKDHVRAGVVGYPNTGKSSVINALRGGGPAKTSSSSGFTHGRQNIRLSKKVTIIDTPGVIPYREKNDIKHAIIGTRNPEQLEAPENAVMALMSRFPALIESHYGIPAPLDLAHADHENTLEAIALRYGRIRKGGLPDTVTMARIILADWQQGKISLKDYRFSAL
ncbi:hypothetical protein COY95_02740 [Candidatus Woesearchaeota archaeon CG_4_10_14_0_8_um_filter_47_5]|nr:MAG: hypothetical protein COY95_02740 [Candidatus Woesearchaeota archaeon CG_4_10_14_0_8_um_filter_47_5]